MPTQSVSASRHATDDLASGSEKPSGTKLRVFVSNSLFTAASDPPGERLIMQRT